MMRRTTSKERSSAFERSYRTTLGRHAKGAAGAGAGRRIGFRARRVGIGTLALARIHDRAVAMLASPGSPARQESFFSEAVAPTEEAHCGKPAAEADVARLTALLARREAKLSVACARLAREAERRKALQVKASTDGRAHGDLVGRSREMEERLRHLSRRLLSAQEEERLRISRDLHDAIGQTLTGINVGLATLKQGAAADSRDLAEAITLTQQLVEKSMKTVHQFAWELRPTLLDDLGLVPAVRSYVRLFSERTGIPVTFAADAEFDGLDDDRSIALFRVAQGALSNVERHAHATHASVVVRSLPGAIRLEVSDDGRSFDARRTQASKTDKHLGLIVMRERVEMVGGKFSIASAPGRGTTVRADVPLEAGGALP